MIIWDTKTSKLVYLQEPMIQIHHEWWMHLGFFFSVRFGLSRRRTRHLGALDEWGQGILEALDDGSGTSRGSYEVTAKHVTVATWTAAF